MRKTLATIALSAALTLGGGLAVWAQEAAVERPQTYATDYSRFAPALIEGYIRPETSALTEKLKRLEQATGALCHSGQSAESENAFRQALSGSIAQLARVDFLRFGPLAENNRAQRLAFLPDRRGVIARQLNKIMATEDPSVTTAESLAGKSVALQGLTALEHFGFATDGTLQLARGDHESFECAYAVALTRNLVGTAQELEAAWADPEGFSKTLSAPASDHALVQTHKEAAELMFNSMVTGLVLIKDQILLPVIGPSVEKAKPYRAPFSRSHNGALYMASSLEGINQALIAAGYMDALPEDGAWAADSLNFEFQNGARVIEELGGPIRVIGKDIEERKKLVYLTLVIDGLKDTLANNVAGYLALSGGFNALDGD
ncbi:imelysin family protein [Pseudovibrio exalbescens]|uniref:imelysin family protein n=1 Tax=Pseudovibrio exalbescens TaxID=197461 RepID=UPI0023666D35|nr:imelysin family protein [Pseudovibrio exalbescens]MDD7911000.1 imelysin family protein [Pseudovibrio exalbescens]